MKTLIEIDLESNPLENLKDILLAIVSKKDLLVFNLHLTPLEKSSYKEFFSRDSDSSNSVEA